MQHHILDVLPDGHYAVVIIALVVGDQGGIAPDDRDLLRRTGISHLVSISGLHIAMIAGLLATLQIAP